VAGGTAGGPRRVLLAGAEAPGRGGPLGRVVPRPWPRRRRGRRGVAPLSRRRYRIEQSPEIAETAARLSPKAKRWLAELYQILVVTPLPGQSDLDVQPHPWLPNIYTVPFLDGHLVYAVLEWKGLVGVLRYDP
jgi:hypothetical protein